METFSAFYEEKIKSTFVDKQDEILENAFLLVLALYLFHIFIEGTTIGVNIPYSFEWLVRVLAAGIGILRIQRIEKKKKSDYVLLFIFIIGFAISYFKTGYTFLLDYVVFILGCFGIEYKKVLKVYLIVGTTVLAAAIFATFIGQATDIVYLRKYAKVETTDKVFDKIYGKIILMGEKGEKQVRHSFGVMYCTDFGAWCFSLALVLWVYLEGIPSILFAPFFFLMSYMVYTLAGARNVAGMFLIAAALAVLDGILNLLKRMDFFKKILNVVCGSVAAAFAPVCLGVVYYVLYWIKDEQIIDFVNGLVSHRLSLSKKMITRYGITWLGNVFDMVGNGGGNESFRAEYTFLDISYVLMVVRYGILFSILVLLLYMLVGIKGSKSQNYRIPMVIALFAAQGIVEHHMVEHAYVIFLMLPLATFSCRNEKKRKKEWKLDILQGLIKCILFAVVGMISLSQVKIYRLLFSSEAEEQEGIYIYIFLTGIVLLLIICRLLKQKKMWWISGIIYVVLVALLFVPQILTKNQTNEFAGELKESSHFLSLLEDKNSLGYKMYVSEQDYLYQKEWADIDSSLYMGDSYAGVKNAVILAPRDKDYYVLSDMGFNYCAITEHYGIYTNSEEAIQLLEQRGLELSAINNEIKEVEMVSTQKFIPRDKAGNIIMKADNPVIYFGPLDVELGQQARKVQVDVKLDMSSFVPKDKNKFIRVSVINDFEKNTLVQKEFKAKSLSEDGVISVRFTKRYTENLYVKVEVMNDNVFHLESITYHKYK